MNAIGEGQRNHKYVHRQVKKENKRMTQSSMKSVLPQKSSCNLTRDAINFNMEKKKEKRRRIKKTGSKYLDVFET